MYITQDIANKVKLQAKKQNISMKKILSECSLNINAVSEFAKGKQLSCVSLAKIADYLNVSVDYLLGRTENIAVVPQNEPLGGKLSQLNELDRAKAEAFIDGMLSSAEYNK